jgi:hypothetical protein
MCKKSLPALFGAQFGPPYFEECSLGVVVVTKHHALQLCRGPPNTLGNFLINNKKIVKEATY